MYRSAVVFPIAPGKTAADVKRIVSYLVSNKDAHRNSRERLGITVERTYLQPGPAGTVLVGYLESRQDYGHTAGQLVTSDLPIDREFVRLIAEVHGIDLTKPPAGPPPETIAEWADPQVSTRRRGIAVVAPLLPGVVEAAKAWAHEAYVTRGEEFVQSRRAVGATVEVVTISQTPMGDFAGVYIEGNDPVEANRLFAASRTPYDAWFKESIKALFPPEIDFNQPLPPVEQIFDYVAEPAMV